MNAIAESGKIGSILRSIYLKELVGENPICCNGEGLARPSQESTTATGLQGTTQGPSSAACPDMLAQS